MLYWPASRAAEGVELLARAAGLPGARTAAARAPRAGQVASAATALGLDVESIDVSCSEVDALLASAGPAVIRMADDQLVMLVRGRGAAVTVVGPDHRI